MKSKMIVKSLGLAALIAASAGAFAHGNDDYRTGPNAPAFYNHPAQQESLRLMREINARQEQQRYRIQMGFNARRITPHEFRRLMDQQQDIQRMERAFLSDGFLNRFEYHKLDAALEDASRNIFRQAHDDEGRSGRWDNRYSQGYGNWQR